MQLSTVKTLHGKKIKLVKETEKVIHKNIRQFALPICIGGMLCLLFELVLSIYGIGTPSDAILLIGITLMILSYPIWFTIQHEKKMLRECKKIVMDIKEEQII